MIFIVNQLSLMGGFVRVSRFGLLKTGSFLHYNFIDTKPDEPAAKLHVQSQK